MGDHFGYWSLEDTCQARWGIVISSKQSPSQGVWKGSLGVVGGVTRGGCVQLALADRK